MSELIPENPLTELERRLLKLKTSNRQHIKELKILKVIKKMLKGAVVEDDVCITISRQDYVELCKDLGIPVDDEYIDE